MRCTVRSLVEEARVLLDLNPVGYACGDTLTVDRILTGRLQQAVSETLAEAPLPLLGAGAPLKERIVWHRRHEKWWGSILLPADFVRMLVFEMTGWSRAARFIQPDSPLYPFQHSPYSGVGGCPERPVAVVVPSAFGPQLEFFSCHCCREQVAQARYLPLPQPDTDGFIDLPPALTDQVARRMAALAAQVLAD